VEYLSGTVRLRPTRIGFLVRPTQQSYSDVRRIIRLCSCLWGGTFNPIIPVTTKLPDAWRREPYRELSGKGLADAFIRFFEPDVFVEAERGLAAKAGIKTTEHDLHDRVVTLNELVQKDGHRRADFLFGLNIFDAYRDLYERKYQFVIKKPQRFLLFEDKCDAYCEAVFGAFPLRKELAYIRQGYLDAFEPEKKACSPKDCLEVLKSQLRSPLTICDYEIEVQSGSREDPTIYVFDPDCTSDLIDYWNLRQFRRHVLPIDVRWFLEAADLIVHSIKGLEAVRDGESLPGARGLIVTAFRWTPANPLSC
jgi:hypothetical protein